MFSNTHHDSSVISLPAFQVFSEKSNWKIYTAFQFKVSTSHFILADWEADLFHLQRVNFKVNQQYWSSPSNCIMSQGDTQHNRLTIFLSCFYLLHYFSN